MTKPLDANDRAAVLAALKDHRPDNPLAVAVAARIEALMTILEQAMVASDELPPVIEFAKPQTAVDEVAFDLFRQTVEEQLAATAALLDIDPARMGSIIEIRVLEHGDQ